MEREVSGRERPAIVGRVEELLFLDNVADEAMTTGTAMAVISGDAGIGKSSLIAASTDRLRAHGWSVHVGHCIEYADRPLPFGPIAPVLRSLLGARVDQDAGSGASGLPERRDLGALLPELRDPDAAPVSLAGDVDRLIAAIASVVRSTALSRPRVIVIEDVHWADPATRDLLTTLVRHLAGVPLFLIVSERTGAVTRDDPIRVWLAEQRRYPNVHDLPLHGLSESELAEQAALVLGRPADPSFLIDLVERTAGNAYFSHELLVAHREGSDALPSSLKDFLSSRLQRVSADEQAVLRAMAIAGRPVSHATVVAMLPNVDVAAAVRSLFDRGTVHVDDDCYVFRHALLRDAILADILPFEAVEFHRRAAEAIIADPRQGSTPAELAELARHWAGAHDVNRSLEAAVVAADASAAVAAFDHAAEMAVVALDAWASADEAGQATGRLRDDLLVDAAQWFVGANRAPEAEQLLEAALAGWAAEPALTSGRRARVMARLAMLKDRAGARSEASNLLDAASRVIGDDESAEAAEVHHWISKHALGDGHIHPARAAAERAAGLAARFGPEFVLVEALTVQGLAVGVIEDRDRGIALIEQARARAHEAHMVAQVVQTHRTEMMVIYFHEGRQPQAIEALQRGLTYAESNSGPGLRTDVAAELASALVEAGRLTEGQRIVDDVLLDDQPTWRRGMALHVAALAALIRRDLDAAERYLDESDRLQDVHAVVSETGFRYRLRAELARYRGELDRASDFIERALELQLAQDNVTFTRESVVEKARIVTALIQAGHDDPEGLIADADAVRRQLSIADPASQAMDSLMRLELDAAAGPVDAGRIRAVAEQLEATWFVPDAVVTRLRLAEHHVLMAATNDPSAADSRAELASTLVGLHRRGIEQKMPWLVARTEELARSASIELEDVIDGDSAPVEGADADAIEAPRTDERLIDLTDRVEQRRAALDVTDREFEVLTLLAEGLTNKAIGQQLYVSHRTISTHVSNLLAKLHVANRAEAAALYHRLGSAELDLRDQPSRRPR